MAKKPGAKSIIKREEVALTGIFLAFILAVGVLERMIPLDFIVPGARLGFSNVVVLVSIYIFRFRISLILVLLKCLLTSALAGGPSSLIYSLSGSLLSFVVMYILVKALDERISPIGVSVAGAAAHSTGQIIASCLVLESIGMFAYLPVLLVLSVISGVLVGFIVKNTVPRLRVIMPKLQRDDDKQRAGGSQRSNRRG
ncbi:MAG: Gx transporter family protein [Clostridiales Family XIII bacterium]|nr:Gx transporter family protein [Clostridiales Family XIII bacterium]